MADPQDDYQNEAMMDIINTGTQYGPNEADNPDFDDDSQYLNFDGDEKLQENDVQENIGKVYILLIKRLLIMKLNIITFSYLWNFVRSPPDWHRRKVEMYEGRQKS